MGIADRLRNARKAKKYTLEEASKLIGIDRTTLNKYELGKIEGIPLDKIERAAEVYSVSPSHLMGWTEDEAPAPLPSNVLPMPKTYKIPLLGDIACGTPILATENLDGSVEVPDNIHADFSLRCKGDSMINARIHDGDIVYIRQQEQVEDGEIAAVLIDDAATLKRVKRIGTYIALQPCNDNYQDIIIDTTKETVRILGKAVGFTSVL